MVKCYEHQTVSSVYERIMRKGSRSESSEMRNGGSDESQERGTEAESEGDNNKHTRRQKVLEVFWCLPL